MTEKEKFPGSVLIVEDDMPSRIFMSTLVKTKVKEIFVAENGYEGLQLYKEHLPDVVVTDIDMPKMNGLDMSRNIKEINKDALIILTTALDNKNTLLDAINIGINQFIIKPIQRDTILKALDKVFKSLKLVMDKEAAEAENEAKNLFLAKVSHELRTPMNGILGFTSILLDTKLDDKQKKFLNMVKYSADNLLKIINDILDFTIINSDEFVIHNYRFNFHDAIQNVYNIMKQNTDRKNLEFNLNVDENIPTYLITDARRLEQALHNVIGNAVKFTDKGKIDFSIRIVERKDNKIVLSFTISDTGIGIPEGQINQLFKSFSQIDGTLTRKYGGVGLGLTITKEIVDRLEGKIEVKNNPDQGATFNLIIPLKVSAAKKSTIEIEELNAGSNFKKSVEIFPDTTIRILLVEDSYINREVIKEALEAKNWDVNFANNGIEALEEYKKNDFDIILMDVQMPDMDGLVATKHIRELEEINGKHVPIIGITAHAGERHKQKCIDAGMDDYISKPFKWHNLYHKVIVRSGRMEHVANIDKLMESLNQKPDVFVKIASYFIDNYKNEIKKLEKFLSQRDFNGISSTAHKLKSEIGHFGAENAYNLAFELQNVKEDWEIKKIKKIIFVLYNELKLLEFYLTDKINSIQKN